MNAKGRRQYKFIPAFIKENFRFDFTKTHLHRFDIAVDVANLRKSDLIPHFDAAVFSGHIAGLKNER